MKTLIIFAFVVYLATLTSAIPAPLEPAEPGSRAPIPYVRVARESSEPKKDLEGAESAYVVYPYYYPHYWGGHYVLYGR